MQGLMQDWPLTLDKILDHAKAMAPNREVVTRSVEGPIIRSTYGEIHGRAKQVTAALKNAGVRFGDRVATLAWNSSRHMEVWFGAQGMGAVLHTLNPRLFPEQIAWIANHAEDKILFLDLTFVPLVEKIAGQLATVERYVILTDAAHMPQTSLPNAVAYEDFIAGWSADIAWGGFDENTAAGLCYTSGTTGNPKGVLYSHRSNVIHAMAANTGDAFGLRSRDVVLPVVPLFHANAWALTFIGPMAGCKMVMPGARLDGASVYELLESEGVTLTAAVPTVWLMLLSYLRENQLKLKQGRAPFTVEMKIVDDAGKELPRDGKTFGRLQVRGPAVTRAYFKGDGARRADGAALEADGFFDTGDVATLDPAGFMQITDRAKDVIKSGGEWISSIEIENIAVGAPGVANAAVIGVAHPKWDERPLLIIEAAQGAAPDKGETLAYLEGKIAKWWMPDDVAFVEKIPLGATGKINKLELRKMFADYRLPTA